MTPHFDHASDTYGIVEVGIYCDHCGDSYVREYMVTRDMVESDWVERARVVVRQLGWQCTPGVDLCPVCTSPRFDSHRGRYAYGKCEVCT